MKSTTAILVNMLYWANRAEIERTYGPGLKVLSLLLQSKLLLLIAMLLSISRASYISQLALTTGKTVTQHVRENDHKFKPILKYLYIFIYTSLFKLPCLRVFFSTKENVSWHFKQLTTSLPCHFIQISCRPFLFIYAIQKHRAPLIKFAPTFTANTFTAFSSGLWWRVKRRLFFTIIHPASNRLECLHGALFFFRGEALYQCSSQVALHILIWEHMGIYHPALPGRVHTLPLGWRCCLSGGVNPTTNLSLQTDNESLRSPKPSDQCQYL